MRVFSVVGRRALFVGALVGVLGAVGVLAPSAGAVLVHVGHGQVAGVTPVVNVNPTLIPGSFAHLRASNTAEPAGTLDYHGGAVMHGATPFLVFWDPSNRISAADKALYARFFTDSAADSGLATNVYSVDRQFTDATGFANYQQVFSPAQAITDTHPYPASGQCTESSFPETACLFDSQLQTELTRLIAANALPTGITGKAPEYFMVTPSDVNTCFPDGSTCADNFYCAYHSSFTDGGSTVLYSSIATVLALHDPKGCQFDNNSAVQAPNGPATHVADVTLKAMSHEFNETITDPVNGGGWYSTASGQENGDQCNFYNATSDPARDGNPNAFTPTLGGSASAGTLFNQLMQANPYYVQSEWSNQGLNCRMSPTPSALTAAFTAPAGSGPGAAVSFDPSSSSAAAGYSSTTWSWGDGTANSFNTGPPATLTHTYAAIGTYTVTLTVVDRYGNLSSVSHVVSVGTPVAAFSFSPPHPEAGAAVAFDGTASSDSGGTIASYSWDFGDGRTGTGATLNHTYPASGSYTVTLTVSDGTNTDSTTHGVTVDAAPSAAFSVGNATPGVGAAVGFDATGSTGAGLTYSWDFGDGSATGNGVMTSHAYGSAGAFVVKLTVTDQDGHTATVSHVVSVHGTPTAAFNFAPSAPVAGSAVSFDGSSSTDPGSTISGYSWDFGDGTAGTGKTTSHIYNAAGTYAVKLTVSDGSQTNSITHTVNKVVGVPAAVPVSSGNAVAGVPFAFDGSGSHDLGSTLTSYSWTFGDGGTATGVSPAHVFSNTGLFSVTLTVTDASGAIATATESVLVTAPPITNASVTTPPITNPSVTAPPTTRPSVSVPSITGVSVKKGVKVELFTVTLSGSGLLRLGARKIKVGRLRTVTFKVKLSKGQLKTLHRAHILTVRYKLTFTPSAGKTSSRTVVVRLATKRKKK